MFWKNKKKNSEENDQELFEYKDTSRRQVFRVEPPSLAPIDCEVDGKPVKVVNIGAGGIAFENRHFSLQATYDIIMQLSVLELKVAAQVKILNIDADQICHCQFIQISENAVEAIHRYVLNAQKIIIRQKKKAHPLEQI